MSVLKRLPKIEIYRDNKGEFRWRITAGNGEIIGASTESFTTKQNCIKDMKQVGEIIMNHMDIELKL